MSQRYQNVASAFLTPGYAKERPVASTVHKPAQYRSSKMVRMSGDNLRTNSHAFYGQKQQPKERNYLNVLNRNAKSSENPWVKNMIVGFSATSLALSSYTQPAYSQIETQLPPQASIVTQQSMQQSATTNKYIAPESKLFPGEQPSEMAQKQNQAEKMKEIAAGASNKEIVGVPLNMDQVAAQANQAVARKLNELENSNQEYSTEEANELAKQAALTEIKRIQDDANWLGGPPVSQGQQAFDLLNFAFFFAVGASGVSLLRKIASDKDNDDDKKGPSKKQQPKKEEKKAEFKFPWQQKEEKPEKKKIDKSIFK